MMEYPVKPVTVRAGTYILIKKLAAWFKTPVKDIFDETAFLKQGEDWDPFVWHSPVLAERFNFRHVFRTIQVSKINLLDFLDLAKWEASKYHEEFVAGESKVEHRQRGVYLLAIQVKGQIWVAKRVWTGYEGLGGIFVGKAGIGYAIEPIKNFLAYNFPVPE